MAAIDDWLDLMGQTVTVRRWQSMDAYGKPVFAAPVNYAARIDYRSRNVGVEGGELRVARGVAWLGTVDKITTRDQITLDDGSTAIIINLSVIPDENGPLYTRLDFG